MIKVLIVEDSKTETLLLKSLLESDKNIEVVGCARNGEEALKLTAQLKPDLITMDLAMPIVDGFEATRQIMSRYPTPVVVISSRLDDHSLNASFQALSAGALAVLDKPRLHSESFLTHKNRILDTVRSMAEIKVVTRRFPASVLKPKSTPQKPPLLSRRQDFELIAIGSSVGGPQALQTILSKLPKNFPLPIVVVQHMTEGFIKSFTQWMDQHMPLRIKEAEDFETLRAGTVYFAPDKFHLEVMRNEKGLYSRLSKGTPVSGFYPSATVLLQSVAKVSGQKAIGLLLTGMGSDGALGLLDLKKAHGHTVTQDEQSAVVYGMAGVAHSLGAVDRSVDLDKLADYLLSITPKKKVEMPE